VGHKKRELQLEEIDKTYFPSATISAENLVYYLRSNLNSGEKLSWLLRDFNDSSRHLGFGKCARLFYALFAAQNKLINTKFSLYQSLFVNS